MIYAIEAVGLDRVKFGKAKDPKSRFRTLSTGSPVPLELIIVAPWADLYEGVIHRAFADERITGEWFLATKRVEEFCHLMGAPDLTDEERFEKSMSYIGELQPNGGSPIEGQRREVFAQGADNVASDGPMEVFKPLTPAQKQQRHRDKLKADPVRYEAYLLKERERKRNHD